MQFPRGITEWSFSNELFDSKCDSNHSPSQLQPNKSECCDSDLWYFRELATTHTSTLAKKNCEIFIIILWGTHMHPLQERDNTHRRYYQHFLMSRTPFEHTNYFIFNFCTSQLCKLGYHVLCNHSVTFHEKHHSTMTDFFFLHRYFIVSGSVPFQFHSTPHIVFVMMAISSAHSISSFSNIS